jgi:short-subunit dehydrogenase
MFDYAHTTALVTGASSGLGETFAEMLAARGANLVLVARTGSRLEALAARLRSAHRIQADVIAADLTDPGAPASVHAQAQSRGLRVNLLVNNAGFALGGAFLEHELRDEEDQIAVNVTALTALSHLFGRDMAGFGRNAGIINIASNAAFQPLPYSAVYAASKAYVLLFSEALGRELVRQGPHVLVVCPGQVRTRFWDRLGSALPTDAMDTPERIVTETLAAFERRRAVLIPGRVGNRLQAFATRFMPRAAMIRIAERASRKIMMAGRS